MVRPLCITHLVIQGNCLPWMLKDKHKCKWWWECNNTIHWTKDWGCTWDEQWLLVECNIEQLVFLFIVSSLLLLSQADAFKTLNNSKSLQASFWYVFQNPKQLKNPNFKPPLPCIALQCEMPARWMYLTSFVKDKTAQVRAQLVYGRKEAHLSHVYEIFFLTSLQRYPVNPNWNLADGAFFWQLETKNRPMELMKRMFWGAGGTHQSHQNLREKSEISKFG